MWQTSEAGRLDRLVVFKFHVDAYVPAGLLTFEGRGARRAGRFAYAQSYLARKDARPIDPVGLALKHKSASALPEEVHPAFHDSGPDGWGKGLLDRAFPSRRLGMPEYLALGSTRRTGDLAYGPTMEAPATWRPSEVPLVTLPTDDDDVEALLKAAEAVDAGEGTDSHLGLLMRTSADLGGARPKARLWHEGGDWIAKFSAWGDTFDDPKLEAVCLDVAAAAGIETPRHELLAVAGRSVLLVARFDRLPAGRPCAYLSAASLLGEASVDYATAKTYVDIVEVGRRIGVPGLAAEMFRRFLLNAFIHNTDDHLRNHAFIDDGAGWRLSPVFDVVPHLRMKRHVCAPAAGFNPAWDPDQAFEAHARFGLALREAEALHDTVRAAVDRLPDFMDMRKVSSRDRGLVLAGLKMAHRI